MNKTKRMSECRHVCAVSLQVAVWAVVVIVSPEASGVAVTSAASNITTAARTFRLLAPPVRRSLQGAHSKTDGNISG